MAWVFVEIDDPLLFQTTRFVFYYRGLCQSLNLKEDDDFAIRLRARHREGTAATAEHFYENEEMGKPYLKASGTDAELEAEDVLSVDVVVSGGFIGGPVDVKVRIILL